MEILQWASFAVAVGAATAAIVVCTVSARTVSVKAVVRWKGARFEIVGRPEQVRAEALDLLRAAKRLEAEEALVPVERFAGGGVIR